MAEDFDRIRGNVQKMIGLQAPEQDIDGYLQSEGLTPDQFKARVSAPVQPEQPLAPGPFTQKTPDGRLITRPPTPQESKPMDWAGAANAGLASAMDTTSFNQDRKLFAGMESLAGDRPYEKNLATINDQFDRAKAANKGAAFVGGAAGAYLNPITRLASRGANAVLPTTNPGVGGLVSKYANRVGVGALAGAGQGAGEADPGDRIHGAVRGAERGAGLALAAQVGSDLLGVASKTGSGASAPSKTPAEAEQALFNQKQSLYKQSEGAGVTVTPDAFKQFVDDLPAKLKNFRPRLAPETANLLEELQADVAKGPRTLSDLDELRQLAAETAKGAKPNDIRLINNIKDHLDDFMDNLKPSQLLAEGADPYQVKSAAAAVDALKNARQAARAYYKLRDINDLVETGENLNNANWTKNQFAAIVRRPQKLAQYSADEQEAIKEIARTGDLRKWLKLIPLRGVQMIATYAEPFMQNAKINALQGLIAKGGRANTASVFGGNAAPTGLITSAGGLWAAQPVRRRQAISP